MRKILAINVMLVITFSLQAQVIYEQTFKFGRVLEWLDRYYVDSVNQEQLVEEAIVDLLKKLDPHSIYISKEEVKKMNEPLEGNFEGVGIYFNVLNDTILVISPISGGPSEKVGIRAGDRIVTIDSENVGGIGISTTDVTKKLKGPKGTQVNVSVLRRGVDELLDFKIVRDKIPIYSVDAAYMLNKTVGYVKINRFAHNTINEFETAVKKLQKEGLKDIVIDLTGNGGGYLDMAVKLADHFLTEGQLIVYTKGRNTPKNTSLATKQGIFDNSGKVVVLIDEGSASASEIMAGAIQDWDRGVIIGRRSFGKGLVQSPLMLPDQSMIRLTVARYYTPTGRLIQKPYSEGADSYELDILKRYENGEFNDSENIEFPDSLKYKTLTKGRLVYGGGGIMPDVFIPIDTVGYSDYFNKLIRKGILNSFVLDYVDKYRTDFNKKYLNFDEFSDSYMVEDEVLEELVEYASNERLLFKEEEFNTSKEEIRMLVKAYVARDLWHTSEFYEVVNENDEMIQKALEVMGSDKFFSQLLN
jgi:carboxyl-terminal processing protease